MNPPSKETAGMTMQSPRAKLRIARLVEALGERPRTAVEASGDLFMVKATAIYYINYLRSLPEWDRRRVYVCGWQRGAGNISPIYALGSKKDAPKPPRLTGKQKYAKARKRLVADMERYDQWLAKRRAAAFKPKADPMLAWIPRRDMREAA